MINGDKQKDAHQNLAAKLFYMGYEFKTHEISKEGEMIIWGVIFMKLHILL